MYNNTFMGTNKIRVDGARLKGEEQRDVTRERSRDKEKEKKKKSEEKV